jgi:transcriptional regulator with XRE-family HTH domain
VDSTDHARAKNRHEATRRYLRGELQASIAEALGTTQATISRWLSEIRREWQEDAKASIGEKVAKELAKIDELESTYWKAWCASCGQRENPFDSVAGIVEETRDEIGESKKAGIFEKSVSTKKRVVGNPAFLDGVFKCIDRRLKLLGADAPTKISETDPEGNPVRKGGLSDEAIREIERKILGID